MQLVNEPIIYKKKIQSRKNVYMIFFGILVFLTIYFPFYGSSTRYELGNFFSLIFTMIGTILVFVGVICILYGILMFFTRSPPRAFSFLLLGFIFITIGGFFLSPSTVGAGDYGTEQPVPQGFH